MEPAANGARFMNRRLRANFLLSFLCLASCLCTAVQAVIPASQRAVLLDLYTGTNGAGWTTSTNWNGAAGTECTWFGITCDAGQNNVTRIQLNANQLNGNLPLTLNALTQLQRLRMIGNPQLGGGIPSLSGMTEIEDISLSDNALTGTIPSLAGLNNLQTLDLQNNQLSGTIPSLNGLSDLREFVVSRNQLTGSIPTVSGQGLSALRIFRVTDNQLTGTLPSLTGLTNLQNFQAGINQLSGSIPALSAQGLNNLRVFLVANNQLTGALPALTGLDELAEFEANNNQLSGSLPALAGLQNLIRFAVRSNQLSGAMPAFSDLPLLRIFLVNDNQLTGTIPTLTSLTNLSDFDASDNMLDGALPDWTGLDRMMTFNVRGNQLSGPIPPLTGLSFLVRLDVSFNQLSGSLPALTGLGLFNALVVNNNQLTGNVPSVPAGTNLAPGQSALCPNLLTVTIDPVWDAATGMTPWSTACGSGLIPQVLNFAPAPSLMIGGTGTVVAISTPTPGSSAPIVYSSLTPGVCSVGASTGLVTVLPAAVIGNTCTVAADKAGDAVHSAAAQIQQSMVIAGATPTQFTVTPSVLGGNGSISPDTPQSVPFGGTQIFLLTPDAGFSIAGVTGSCGGVLSGSSYTTSMISNDCTVVATFVAAPIGASATAIPSSSIWSTALLALGLFGAAALIKPNHG
jgi:Leucine-rich repeat (LRR) protein